MATMIAAVTTTAIFSVVLSGFVSSSRADKRDAAAMAMRYAQETLKGYVSADPGNASYVPNSGRWSAESPQPAWALSAGPHYISSLVAAPNPLSPPGVPAASLQYNVTDVDCGFGTGSGACKQVVFQLTYTE